MYFSNFWYTVRDVAISLDFLWVTDQNVSKLPKQVFEDS